MYNLGKNLSSSVERFEMILPKGRCITVGLSDKTCLNTLTQFQEKLSRQNFFGNRSKTIICGCCMFKCYLMPIYVDNNIK
jgi:hypothetical protein